MVSSTLNNYSVARVTRSSQSVVQNQDENIDYEIVNVEQPEQSESAQDSSTDLAKTQKPKKKREAKAAKKE